MRGLIKLVLLQVILLCLLLLACGSSGTSLEEPQFSDPPDVVAAISSDNNIHTISWKDASEYIGQYAIVTGTVVLTYYAQDSNGKPTFLNFHDPYEGFFTCVIWGDDRKHFPDSPETYYLNKQVHVRGFVTEYNNAPEMILGDASQIRLLANGEQWVESPYTLPPDQLYEEAQVTDVIDGDTIEIEGGQLIRYIGIDTPETVHPDKPTECYGPEASRKNHELVSGKTVRLERDIENRDQYGRLLRYVYVDDLMINMELVKLGYAKAVLFPPNTRYTATFLQLEKEAEASRAGLWGECMNPR